MSENHEEQKRCDTCRYWNKAGFALRMGECQCKGTPPRLMYEYENCDRWEARR